MSGRSAERESGFTLVEIVIAVAIVATTVAAGFGISLASRSLAVSTAAGEFDQFLDSARTMARDLDGATLAFTADAYGDGTEVRLLAGGPNSAPSPTTLPTLHARAAIEEAESLGKTPFAFILHANGSLSGRPGYRIGDTAATDVGCPASGAFHFVIKAAGGSADRYVPCRAKLAANGPVTLTAWPLAPTPPSPTPCSGGPGCTATSLPNVPSSTASCPPNFTAIPGGCAPVPPPASGARYHVTITGAPASIAVGATGSFTAQATLTNANAVAPGTPATIPVGIQSADTTCSLTPPGWQQSASSFIITGLVGGSCTVTVAADPSGIAGAMSDTGTTTIIVAAAPRASASPCDLVTNGKCYQRIVDEMTQSFTKDDFPDSNCDAAPPYTSCNYLNSIRFISLDEYTLIPPIAPTDEKHELLFRINRIDGLTYGCIPYSSFSSITPGDQFPQFNRSIGGRANRPLGFGEPSIYATINHLFAGGIPDAFDEKTATAAVIPTLYDLIGTLARTETGPPYSFTYHSADAKPASAITWLPDFPGCDNAGDPATPGIEFGSVSAELSFEVFQASE